MQSDSYLLYAVERLVSIDVLLTHIGQTRTRWMCKLIEVFSVHMSV